MSYQEDNFLVDSLSHYGKWLCVFENDGETGYLYFSPMDTTGDIQGIADALWIQSKFLHPFMNVRKYILYGQRIH